MIRLYGTQTSPYVRRVSVVAHELGLAYELVDTFTAAGQAELRERSPIWKVPAAELDGALVYDSHLITELLLARHGQGQLAPLPLDAVAERNTIAVVDGALDALINCFYLAREGVTADAVPYVAKQHERAAASLAWLEQRIDEAGWLSPARTLGLPEIALATTIGWIRFRNTAPLERYPKLVAASEQLERRESFARTRPSA